MSIYNVSVLNRTGISQIVCNEFWFDSYLLLIILNLGIQF